MRVPARVAGSLLLAAFAVSVSAQSGDQGTWSSKAAMSVPRTEVGAAYVNGKVYVIGGGRAMEDASDLVQEYDVRTDRWRDRAPLPMAISHAGVAVLNGKIYVVGGFLRNV